MKILRIYDNGGETFDRYTVYFNVPHARNKQNRWNQTVLVCLGMSENPFHPQGFCQHSSGQLGSHNGKQITFDQLPADCQKAVKQELDSKYDNLAVVPYIIAETVCGKEYTGQEYSSGLLSPEEITETETKRKKLTHDQVKAFATYADQRCKQAYDARAKWFMKIANSKTNAGRDQLYIFITHWLSAWLKENIQ